MRHKLAEDLFTLSLDRIEAGVECRDIGQRLQANHHFRVASFLARLSKIADWNPRARRNVKRTLRLMP